MKDSTAERHILNRPQPYFQILCSEISLYTAGMQFIFPLDLAILQFNGEFPLMWFWVQMIWYQFQWVYCLTIHLTIMDPPRNCTLAMHVVHCTCTVEPVYSGHPWASVGGLIVQWWAFGICWCVLCTNLFELASGGANIQLGFCGMLLFWEFFLSA